MLDRKVLICLAALIVAGGTLALAADNAAAPAQKPLMSLLDQAGAAKPLQDMGINIYGYIEGSYTYSASSPPNNTITGRAFDYAHEDPTLNQINLTVEKIADIKKAWDWGFCMEWIYGNDSQLIHSVGLFDNYNLASGPDNQFDLTQMYVDLSVPVGNGLLVRAGKFYGAFTPESIDPTKNALYSHSFMAALVAPATFTGVTGAYKVSDDVTVTAGLVRGWNGSLEDNNDAFVSFLGDVKWAIDQKTSLSVRGTFGPEQTSNPSTAMTTDNPNGDYRTLIDVILTHAYSDQLSVTAEGMYLLDTGAAADGSDSMVLGGALYASYKIDSMFTLNTRGEWFHDEQFIAPASSALNIYEATLGVTITPLPNDAIGSNLKIRPEVRVDYSDPKVWDGATDRYQFTFGVDAYFTY